MAYPKKRLTPEECFKIISHSCPKKCMVPRPFNINPRGYGGKRLLFVEKARDIISNVMDKYKQFINLELYIWVLTVDIMDRFTSIKSVPTIRMKLFVTAAVFLSIYIFTDTYPESSEQENTLACIIFSTLKGKIYRPTILEIMNNNNAQEIVDILMNEQSIDAIDAIK